MNLAVSSYVQGRRPSTEGRRCARAGHSALKAPHERPTAAGGSRADVSVRNAPAVLGEVL